MIIHSSLTADALDKKKFVLHCVHTVQNVLVQYILKVYAMQIGKNNTAQTNQALLAFVSNKLHWVSVKKQQLYTRSITLVIQYSTFFSTVDLQRVSIDFYTTKVKSPVPSTLKIHFFLTFFSLELFTITTTIPYSNKFL